MKKRFSTATLEADMAELADLRIDQVRDRWRGRFRDDPPKHRAKDLMVLAFAYRLQAAALGGLKRGTRVKLDDLAQRFACDPEFRPKSSEALKAGTTLIREWNGRRYAVMMTEKGCLYDGKPYSSLSAVAQAITGTKWNGPRFFHLKKDAA